MTEKNQLRKAAEAALAKVPERVSVLTADAAQRREHELRVYQIELELQNEELRRVQAELEESQARYFDLYELAPVGYLTLSEAGLIVQANLTAAGLLGVARPKLLKRPLSRFIHPQDQPAYHRLQPGMAAEAATCVLHMVKADGTSFWGRLTSTAAHDAQGVPLGRVTINDITASKHQELILSARERLLRLSQAQRLDDLLRATLDEAEALTESCAGSYHFLEADENTLSLQAWSTHTEKNLCRAEVVKRHDRVNQAGVWVECIRQRRTVIRNNYAAGLPEGHVALQRELVVPVLRGGRIVAILGVGNKASDYTEADGQAVEALADLSWDIVENKRQEAELRASEGKFRAIADYTVDWESWFGVDGKYLWVNPTVERLTGYAVAEVLAMPDFIAVLVAEVDRGIFREHFQQALRGAPGVGLEFRSCHKDGSLRWLSISWQSIFDAGGQCIGVRTSARDITGKKRLDEVQKFLAKTSSGMEEESFFNALACYLAGILSMDCVRIGRLEGDGLRLRTLAGWCDGHFEGNQTYAIKDTPCGELVGQAVWCVPEGLSPRFPRDERLKEMEAVSYAGCTLWSHKGECIGLISAISRRPLLKCNQAEAILTMVAQRAARELEQQVAEDELRDYQHLLDVIINNSPSQVFAFDLQHRFILLNDELAHFYGLPKGDIWGKPLSEVFPEDLATQLMADNSRIMSNGESLRLEEVIRSKVSDEPRTMMTAKFALRNVQGDIIGIGGVATDVTDYKNALDALRQALNEKVSLLKEIHHRVKNNLQIVSSLLRLQWARVANPATQAALLDMESRVQSMAMIHEHLYRSDNLAAVDLAAYLRQLCHHLFRTLVIAPGSVQLHLDLSHVTLAIDQAIPCGLLVNELVSNAFNHAFPDGRGGSVWVSLKHLADGTGWQLRVADNGVGLPPVLDLGQVSTLGLKLVSDLSRQLGAQLSVGSGPGAVLEVICQPRGKSA
ncbi:MAG: PAS domain S-box protein [Verrucomicrobia bacterium]|nr:MAG: PAS domain S-box protein [Verrucomicrobiota bacterium]